MNKALILSIIACIVASSNNSGMLLNSQRLSYGKRFFCTKLSRCERLKLCKQIEKNKTLIARHTQESTINMQAIWELDNQIRKNIRILNRDNMLEQQQHDTEE